LCLQHTIERRHGNAGCDRQALGLELVVDQRVQAPWIEAQDVIAVAPVQAQHAKTAERAIPAEHQPALSVAASALNRRSSSRRYPVYRPVSSVAARATSSNSGNTKVRC